MKQLNTYITEYIVKKKLDKFIDSEDRYEYCPKTKEELQNICINLINNGNNNLNCIDVSNITDMQELFSTIDLKCVEDIRYIDISKWDVSNVTNMRSMFEGCIELSCDLSNWNVSNVKDMSYMFYGCKLFESDLSNWNVSNVENMKEMFYECISFESDLSNWNVSNVENMTYMFFNCINFTGKGLDNWNTNKLKNKLFTIFRNCKKLIKIPDWNRL